ncbi:saccharopine dehydrogenase family protein [Salisaeta longa]|uniref:saccharopine dehydrogenase family protein n=1 Tax=Salisaeta longa TaxID=503170 RepID=UPI00040A3330|nr:saccharopine dehydrogenase NADP-binding domain-containing protein [Salisaeta longa]
MILIYGAYGYTGTLITEQAVAEGLHPVLAGRNAAKVQALAGRWDLSYRAVALDDAEGLRAMLEDVQCVIHCAGPFQDTSPPMVAACLATGTHYLDITGEIPVLEALAAEDDAARAAGIALLPAVGFDVVPTDCLAAYVSDQLPEATALDIAFAGLGRISRGTARTALRQLGAPGQVRRNGALMPIPAGSRTRTVDFGRGPRTVTTIPWGDLATAYRTTGIPNITAYTQLPALARRLLQWSQPLEPLLQSSAVQHLLDRAVQALPAGPTPDERAAGSVHVWAQATAGERTVTARLHGPDGYAFTARTAVAAAQRVVEDTLRGFHTPATAFGPDFVLGIEGVTREDV